MISVGQASAMRPGPKRDPGGNGLIRLVATKPAERMSEFCSTYLTHVKGELAGVPLVPDRWQVRDIIKPIFGTLKGPLRQYRTSYVEVPRKNAKSTLGSAIALYLLLCDDEPGAEIVSAAADRDQAAVVFDIARSMVEASPTLKQHCVIYRREIVVPSTGSRYKAISAEAYSKHGLNLHGAIIDEVHAHPNRELWDVLATSMGARRQPLTFAITTAGYDRSESNLCWTLHQHAERVLENPKLDPTFWPVIYAAPREADWRSPRVWAKANPGLGVTIKRDYLAAECKRAEEIPSYQNQFRRFHLNQWTESETVWIPVAKWDENATSVDRARLAGRPCYGGLDLSTTTDLSSLVLVFPDAERGGFDVLCTTWCPREGIAKRAQKDAAPYPLWVRDGYLTPTEGNVVDYDVIREDVKRLAEEFRIQEIAFDRWNSSQIVTQLQADGATMVPMGQGFASLSAPAKELEKLVLARKLRHGGQPLLRWAIGNTVIESDPAGNIKPSKRKSTERIDPTVALVMALGRAILHDQAGSVYESRGVVTA
jgi:phage terminase large subunit-like protein